MFDRSQLSAMADWLPRDPHRSLIALYFENPVGEAVGAAHRAPRRWFERALEVWVASSRCAAVAYPDFSGAEGYDLCRPIPEEEFLAVGRQCLCALQRVDLNPQGPFVAALKMSDEWNEVAAVAEYGEEFIAVYWTTGA
jgi:hypothetical protein